MVAPIARFLTGGLVIVLTVCARAGVAEIEPNNSKSTATIVSGMADGQSLSGTTTGAVTTAGGNSVDYFRVQTQSLPHGIYRHRLVLSTSGVAGHTGTIRGLDVSLSGIVNTSSDVALQTSSTTTSPPRFNQWYGFGNGEEIYYRVTGTAQTTASYTATLQTETVTAPNLGVFDAGEITIETVGQGHSTDTDLWVYDTNYQPIAGYGNDDEPAPGNTTRSRLTRSFAAGRYYLAIGPYNIANNMASPPEDRFRGGDILDFPGVTLNSNAAASSIDVGFAISAGSAGSRQFSAARVGPFDVLWYSFDVGGCGQFLYGDSNCDGAVNNFDIDFFVAGLVNDSVAFASLGGDGGCWNKRPCWGDLDRSGGFNNFDIDAFVSCIIDLPPPGQPCNFP